MRLLITGAAGFIGFHLARQRLTMGDTVFAIDNLNDYYDVRLKNARLQLLKEYHPFSFAAQDICDADALEKVFAAFQPERVVHLAAQAGVRYSLANPQAYVRTNVLGFTEVIEACQRHKVEHFIYASTSSVYGAETTQPSHENQPANHPLSVYAATKKSNELIAHAYSHLYGLPTTGLRFFTVYGPWGRPDMAFFSFTRAILAGEPIVVYNDGQLQRDFTYIDDIIAGLSQAIDTTASVDPRWQARHPNAASSYVPYRIYNLGFSEPVNLLDYINAIEQALGKKAIKKFQPLLKTDMASTHANIHLAYENLAYQPKTAYEAGIRHFIDWYLSYYGIGSSFVNEQHVVVPTVS